MTGTPNVTPNEIRNAKFSTSLRGIKRSEVEEFLNSAADALEDALSVAVDYQERFIHLQEKHEKLASIERTLKTTLLEAKKSASSLIESAKADAKNIITAAGDKQLAIENRAKERVDQMQARIEKLNEMRVEYQNSLSEVIGVHLHTIKEMHVQSPEIDTSDEALSDIKDDEIANVIEYEAGETTDAEKVTGSEEEPAPESSASGEEDDEMTKTWRTIQETDTDGPATTATLTDGKGTADLFGESELDKYESDSETVTDKNADGSPESPGDSKTDVQEDRQSETTGGKGQETVVERIARAVRSARVPSKAASAASESTKVHTTPVNLLDEDTLYMKLAREHETEREVTAETAKKVATSASADSRSTKSAPELPGPGPDGIMVFGRKEDRERSVEENVKVLQELDSVIDRFTEELEDIQRK